MSETYIDYDAKVQDALRGVVRAVLKDTEKDGLMGEHHFYIAFKTQAEGVDIPAHLVSRFPEEMTIVLQHKFWGLKVEEDHFMVGLSFNQKPEHLRIPFDAVVGFVDPSVQFALQFHEDAEFEDEDGELEQLEEGFDKDITPDFDDAAPTPDNQDEPDDKTDPTGTDNVVTLDAFRKK
ncbi:SspB family protein [Kordiimonas aestuarii]|uniref:SspB family protein n=1 Tax=Kordiimonas aestuarii TaxID=1005925 RepID=UPI0021D2AF0F|nr:ClpXP protease specificity-enhancing factor SspB [Kordiimonas aestuarii]